MIDKAPSFLVAASLLAVVGCSSAPHVTVTSNSPYGQEGLRVTGTAEVRAKPDYAMVTLGFECSRPKARDARSANSEVMAKVFQALKAGGIEGKDIQTVDLQLSSGYIGPEKAQRLVWTLRNVVRVKVVKVETVSEVIDSATDAGANAIGGVQFEVDDLNALKSKAREIASKIAREKAEQLAKQLGAKIGKVVSIQDGPTYNPWYGSNTLNGSVNYQASIDGAGSTRMPAREAENVVSEGQIKVTAQEEVVYALE